MKKKFLALVLTLAMVLSLVPATALAVGENSPVTEVSTDANSPVQIKKSVNEEGDMLTLEAYLTNEVTQTVSAKPLDIVLVLDQSGSMAYDFDGETTSNYSDTRQYAMKSAVVNFVDKVNEQYSENGDHHMAIVTFGSNATTLHDWTAVDTAGVESLKNKVNTLPQQPEGATNVGAGMEMAKDLMNSVPASSNTTRQKVVIVFTDGVPTTQSYFSINVANAAITASKDMKDAGAVVYTVGIFNGANPNEMYGASGFNVNSNGTIDSVWKQEKWGLFPNTDFPTVDRPAGNRFLNLLSSNYPAADSIGLQRETLGLGIAHSGVSYKITKNFTPTASNYYLTADNKSGLNNIFQQIIEEISTLEIVADKNAVLSDTLSDYFTLNIPESSNAENAITAKQWDCTGKDENGCYTWKEASTQPEMQINVTDKTVKVTGFDYTKNAVTKTTSGSGAVYSGSKLVVTIPIKPDAAYTKWEKGRNLYPTNNVGDNKAGLSNYKDKNGEALLPTLLTESPEAEVTAYTVTYNWGENAPSGQKLPTDSRNYIPGQSYTVNSSFTKDTNVPDANGGSYQFSGWTDPNNPKGVMGTNDVTITGSWTYTEPTPPDPTYTLTYDANGGKADLVPTDSKDYTSGETATLKYDPQPTHAKVNEKNVIFIGWSERNDTGKIYDKGDAIPDLIQSVTMNDNKTVYAVWGLDENGNNTPDVFEATVTYKIENGYWFDSGTDGPVSTDPVTAQFTLYEKKGNQWVAQNPTLGNTSPTGRGADAGYTADDWYKDSETTATSIDAETRVTGDVTYTFKYVKTSTEATWDVSRSKTATNLGSNYESKVTLSLPSAEEQLASDVVFVLDKSTSATLEQQALDMLTKLKEQAGSTKAKVKVGVVIFNKQANVTPLTDLATGYDTIEQAIKQEIKKGTNTHAGLLAGKQMLDGDTEVSANRKYLIFVSDGISYMYDSDGKVVPYYWRSDTPYTSYDPYSWSFKYGDDNPPADWSAWVTQIGDIIKTENVTPILYAEHKAAVDNKTLDISQYTDVTDFATNQYTTCVDRALYYTYQTYTAAKNEGYNCYAVVNGSSTTYPWGPDFMNYLADGKTVNFDKIQNDILYAVSAGSTVTDIIGSKFSFEGIKSLTVGKQELTATKSGENTWYFGNDNTASESNYRFKVVYNSQDHQFVWTINEKVSNFAPVQLTYTVKLTKPETAAGTYGVTDLNGDEKVDDTGAAFTDNDKNNALYTNESATLVPVNSAGKQGQPLLFHKPSVSYTIKGSSGGHGGNGGGTVTIPDDVPTGLNGKDHYAYVVGYPDGMVYPQKNITRAEVATIFFRLLKDETREANMTKSNGYNDMKDGAWYTCAVSTLSKMGIIKGYEDGSFKPDASISRAEFAAIAARFDPDGDKTPATFSDVSSHWAKDEISIAANHGWIKGYEDGSFKPDQKITRAETMTLVNRVLKRLPETKDDLHKDMKTWPDNQKESAWFYLAVQEATNSHYQKLKKDGTHETWESMRDTRDWAALEK